MHLIKNSEDVIEAVKYAHECAKLMWDIITIFSTTKNNYNQNKKMVDKVFESYCYINSIASVSNFIDRKKGVLRINDFNVEVEHQKKLDAVKFEKNREQIDRVLEQILIERQFENFYPFNFAIFYEFIDEYNDTKKEESISTLFIFKAVLYFLHQQGLLFEIEPGIELTNDYLNKNFKIKNIFNRVIEFIENLTSANYHKYFIKKDVSNTYEVEITPENFYELPFVFKDNINLELFNKHYFFDNYQLPQEVLEKTLQDMNKYSPFRLLFSMMVLNKQDLKNTNTLAVNTTMSYQTFFIENLTYQILKQRWDYQNLVLIENLLRVNPNSNLKSFINSFNNNKMISDEMYLEFQGEFVNKVLNVKKENINIVNVLVSSKEFGMVLEQNENKQVIEVENTKIDLANNGQDVFTDQDTIIGGIDYSAIQENINKKQQNSLPQQSNQENEPQTDLDFITEE